MNKKTKLYFGPPLNKLTEGDKNTLEISGTINRTAERYMEILNRHGVNISEVEKSCLKEICHIGYMSTDEIAELPIDVRLSKFEADGFDKETLAKKLESATYADLVAVVESINF